jgi:hypothetical protein
MKTLILSIAVLVGAQAFGGAGGFDCDENYWTIYKCEADGKAFVDVCVKRNTGDFEDVGQKYSCEPGELHPRKAVAKDLIRRSQLPETLSGALSFPERVSLYGAPANEPRSFKVNDILHNGSF